MPLSFLLRIIAATKHEYDKANRPTEEQERLRRNREMFDSMDTVLWVGAGLGLLWFIISK